MKFLPFIDSFLPRKAAYHVKIVIGALLIALAANLIREEPTVLSIFVFFSILLLQLEIFIWLGSAVFFNPS